MLQHTARQWAVGHGGFCTAEIRAGHGEMARPIRYVYDCGAMRPRHLRTVISSYLEEVAADTGQIDLVILSHIDWDHVNGLRRLMTDPQVRVARVMLPYLSPAERLLAIARSSAAIGEDGADPDPPDDGDTSVGPDGFELDLMLDPARALKGLDPDLELIFVEDSEHDDQGGLGFDPHPIEDFPALLQPPESLGELGMIAVGSGRTKHDPDSGQHYMSDRNAVRVHETDTWVMWLLAPYVSARQRQRVDEFMEAAAETFGLSVGELHSQLWDRDQARRLVVEHRRTLRDLYQRFGGTNASSMSLYSGPMPQGHSSLSETYAGAGALLSQCATAGTLLTGDAELKRRDDVDALVAHYGPLVPLVGTLHLPHHGSWHNISPDLLAAFPHLQSAVGMTPVNSPHHPGAETVEALTARGVAMHLVTTEPDSAIITRAQAE